MAEAWLIAGPLAAASKQHLASIELIEGAETAAVNPQEDGCLLAALLS